MAPVTGTGRKFQQLGGQEADREEKLGAGDVEWMHLVRRRPVRLLCQLGDLPDAGLTALTTCLHVPPPLIQEDVFTPE